jgi:hypothetical protein
LLGALHGTSCGYATGFTLPDSQTVGVAIFDNDSKQRDIEVEVHSAVTDSLDRMVGATVVDPRNADLVITGTVVTYEHRGGIRDKDNVRLENGVRITIKAQLVRRGSGPPSPQPAEPKKKSKGQGKGQGQEPDESGDQVLRQITVSDDRGFLIEDQFGESKARANALRYLADRLVLDLFADLAYEAHPPAGPGS